jgi:phytoene desaturase
MQHTSKAIVIGSGIAGLASAIRLAVQGFQVEVYEKNQYPGGKLSHFNLYGFQFDAGPSLFTQPENIEALFVLANEPIEPYFQYQLQNIAFKYFYDDGTVVNTYTNEDACINELHNQLGENKTVIQQYLSHSEKLYQNIGSFFLNNSLHKSQSLFKKEIWKALFAAKRKHIFKTMHSINEQSFKNPKTVQLFNRYATYNGSNPYQAPGMLTMIPHLELQQGTYYPKGGMIAITNALYQLALKKGIQFHFNNAVQKIIVHKQRVYGIVVKQENKYADIVVSNVDAYFTYKYLLTNPIKAHKILRQERSSSALIFYWGINRTFSELELHNILFADNYKAEFDSLFINKTAYHDPTVYINITSKCEPGIQAPKGKENWFVMVNTPANVGQDWETLKDKYRDAIIKKINAILKTDIQNCIEVEEVLDPILIETKTSSYQGSLYGTSSNSRLAAFLRHPNFSKQIKGLYFVGGSVHPGGGIPLCLHSAKIMSELVQKKYKK